MEFRTDIFYLVKTKPRQEEVCELNLKNQSIIHYLPRFKTGKREGKPVFPGYVFVKPSHNDNYQQIRSTRGVASFVRFESEFATATDELIHNIKEMIEFIDGKMDQLDKHQKGDKVFIKSGPFKDYNAIFEKYCANESAIILINFLRHQQRVKINSEIIA